MNAFEEQPAPAAEEPLARIEGTTRAAAAKLDLGLIGNGRTAALVDTGGRILWWCYPRFDSDPIFSRLLAGDEEKGFCDVVLDRCVSSRAAYVENTAIIETVMEDDRGNAIRITDFAPRFEHFERAFHPAQIIRRIEPIAGLPRIAIRARPTFDHGKPFSSRVLGSNHIRFGGATDAIRLTTDASLSYIAAETFFALTRPVNLILGPDEPFQSSVDQTAREFLERTAAWWRRWVRALAIPFEWQDVVIRAAITLKLCAFEETGAIIAAHTTSVPEAPGSVRNWDYRFCWLRDAYFVVQALNRLGATTTMSNFINYITSIALDEEGPMKPVYGIVHEDPLTERFADDLAGFHGNGPVRIGNQAAEQIQHDVYGSVILASAHMFIDQRLERRGDEALFRRLEKLGKRAVRFALEPDAGIWEYRGRQRIHTHSAALCWVACDRLSTIAQRLGITDRVGYWRTRADAIRDAILTRAWNPSRNAIVGAFDHEDLDASVLLLPELGVIDANDPRFVATVEAVGRELVRHGHVMRYTAEDDFGLPENAFIVCRFWFVDALAAIGRRDEARAMFQDIVRHRNAFGLLSEDIHPQTGELWGNLPQTYSMAGLVMSAMRLSRSWEDAWCRA